MKITKLYKTLTIVALFSSLSLSSAISADEIALPVISKPAILEEGTQRELSKAQIEELLPWAKNSKMFLNDLLEGITSLSSNDKIERLVEGIKAVVGESSPKNSELLMRYSLNRGLIVVEILDREIKAESVGAADIKLRVLTATVKIALKYYDTDMETLTKKTKAPFVAFGTDYFEFLNELNKSIFDASAQYTIQRTALEWLQWDLYRDLNNTTYAPQIVKINNALKILPTKKLTDAQSIAYIRQIKILNGQLKITTEARIDREVSEKNKINVGDKVIWMGQYSNAYAHVAAIQADGKYTIKYWNDVVQSNIPREHLAVTTGCNNRLCVSQQIKVIKEKYNYALATVIGLQIDGKQVIRFEEGDLKGQAGEGWEHSDLGIIKGCSEEKICVGEKYINTEKNALVEIYALGVGNTYTLKFIGGELDGRLGNGWAKNSLVKDGTK